MTILNNSLQKNTLIKGALLVNEGNIVEADVLISDSRIKKIGKDICTDKADSIIEANGCYLLPGMIDDQVHFREPGLTHKGNIHSESRAAIAGGITSFMEMPNVTPATTTIEALEKKYHIASENSLANYAFYLGATEANIEEIKQLNPRLHCGVKVFMGASTGDLLVEHPEALEAIFRDSPVLIVTHCESSPVIEVNNQKFLDKGIVPQITDHPTIRDTKACYASSSFAVALAKKYHSQLHVLHITSELELSLFESGPIEDKHITAEACVHHLWFSEDDYPSLGNLIKCNPSIKSSRDRQALLQAVNNNIIDIIATDHAPHTLTEKQVDYVNAPAGLPLVESALLTLLDHVHHERMTLIKVVEKVAHNPATRYKIADRGFIREGYFADLVLVDPRQSTLASNNNTRYHCGWTPFNDHLFSSKIISTWVNGFQVFDGDNIIEQPQAAQRLNFNR